MNNTSISDSENNSELTIFLLDQMEYLRRENSTKSNMILNLSNSKKVLFNNNKNSSY